MSSTISRQRESSIVPEERSGPEGGAMSPEFGEVGEVIRNSASRIPDMELEDDIVESKCFLFLINNFLFSNKLTRHKRF